MRRIAIGIVVCSDRASQGLDEDLGGPAVEGYLHKVMATLFDAHLAIWGDESGVIARMLRSMGDETHCPLNLLIGGPRLETNPEICRAFRPAS